jgi:AcrR family transcriptional regulator
MSTQRRAEETRERILSAAQECFAHYGYDGTGVAQLCEQAGVTKGAFYHHFPSKHAVFLELLHRWLAVLDGQLAVARGEAATVPDGLLHMADQAGRIFRDARGQLPMFLEFWTQASQHPEFWQETVAPYRSYQASFAALIEAGIAEGSLRPVNAAVASRAIVAVAVGVLLQGLLDPQGADWGKVMTESMRMMLEGLESGDSQDGLEAGAIQPPTSNSMEER